MSPGKPWPVEVASTIARAYGRTTAVTTVEAKWLLHLIIARLATSACIAAGRPDDNPHHQNTAAGVWTLLATVLAADTDWMSECLAAACLDEAPPSDP